MGFGFGDIASFAAGGPIGYGIYKAATGGGSSDVTQVPLETPEQAAARKGLLDFATTGTYGNYTAGLPYNGSLGDFGMTALEQAGQNQVAGRLGESQSLSSGSNQVLNDLLSTDKYNPLNNEGVYAGLSGKIDRTTREASDALKRNSGFAGSLYSTSTIRGLGEVASRGAENKAATLASLYDNYIGRKVAAAPVADSIARGDVADAYSYGALPRNLNTAKDQAAYAEFQRQQQGKQGQLTALSSVAGKDANFGVPTVSVPNANPWMDVMSLLAQFGGKAAGAYAGKA